ncbi:MAG: alpha/beta hydrolase [Chloroflexota bacterium]|nr:alpha/beta hydrolase [Chloroflexota bacterium]
MSRTKLNQQPIEHIVRANDVNHCVYEWPGEGPPIFFVHATGFHARCWDTIIHYLAGYHAYSVDLRGHGKSDKPEPPYHWRLFGEDVATVVEEMDLRNLIGVGHSMGGHSIALAAGLQPHRFAGLVLCDPSIMAPDHYQKYREPSTTEHPVAKRRNEWSSAQEMYERFLNRSPFNTWRPEMLWDYCKHGLLPATNGEGFVLACPPRIEAAMYGSGDHGDIFQALKNITFPVHVLRAKERTASDTADEFRASVTWPGLADHLVKGKDYSMPKLSHFVPQEVPDVVAWHIQQLVKMAG